MKQLAYKEMLKRSFADVFSNKLLWFLGIFVGGSAVLLDYLTKDWRGIARLSVTELWEKAKFIFSSFEAFTVTLITVVLLVLIFLLVFWARASILWGVKWANNKEKYSFSGLLKAGWGNIKSIISFEIVFGLVNMILAVATGTTLMYLDSSPWMMLLFIIVAVLLLAFNLALFFFKHFIYCNVVLEGRKSIDSVRSGWKLMVSNFMPIVHVKLLEILFWVAAVFAIMLGLILLALPFVLLSVLALMFVGMTVFNFVSMLGLIVLIIALLIFKGMASAYVQFYMTRVFWALKK
jgi:hypothetical protein